MLGCPRLAWTLHIMRTCTWRNTRRGNWRDLRFLNGIHTYRSMAVQTWGAAGTTFEVPPMHMHSSVCVHACACVCVCVQSVRECVSAHMHITSSRAWSEPPAWVSVSPYMATEHRPFAVTGSEAHATLLSDQIGQWAAPFRESRCSRTSPACVPTLCHPVIKIARGAEICFS